MGWLGDNLVLVAGIVAAVLLVAALAYAALGGLALWRRVRRERGRVMPLVDYVSAGADRAQATLGRIEQSKVDQAEAAQAVATHVAEVRVATDHAMRTYRTLLLPIRIVRAALAKR